MWNISNSTEDHRGREGNLKGENSDRETNHERLWTLGNRLGFQRGGWWGEIEAGSPLMREPHTGLNPRTLGS